MTAISLRQVIWQNMGCNMLLYIGVFFHKKTKHPQVFMIEIECHKYKTMIKTILVIHSVKFTKVSKQGYNVYMSLLSKIIGRANTDRCFPFIDLSM